MILFLLTWRLNLIILNFFKWRRKPDKPATYFTITKISQKWFKISRWIKVYSHRLQFWIICWVSVSFLKKSWNNSFSYVIGLSNLWCQNFNLIYLGNDTFEILRLINNSFISKSHDFESLSFIRINVVFNLELS